MLPRRLLTINWADSGPGFSWPVAYYATYVPGYNRTVVTASGDCPDALGVCDIALGSFGPETPLLEGSGAIIRDEWANRRREFDQSRWVYILDTGLVARPMQTPGLTRFGVITQTTKIRPYTGIPAPWSRAASRPELRPSPEQLNLSELCRDRSLDDYI